MDDADRRILRAIQHNPDLTMRELGEVTGLSHTPCWRRLQRMREEGIIRSKAYLLDERAVGYEIVVFCFIRMKEHRRAKLLEFEAAAARIPEVMQCYSLTGDYDYVLRVLARNMQDYEQNMKESIVELPNVASINTSVTMKEIKNTTIVPV